MSNASNAKQPTVAQFITEQIAVCGKSDEEIAKAMGYASPKIIAMIKRGDSKLPVNKVIPLAQALGIDPAVLLHIVLADYMPETWATIRAIHPELVVGSR